MSRALDVLTLTDADITALLPIWQQGSWTLPDYGRWVARAVERAHGIKTSHNLCLSCGHSIDAHDRQYGCAEDGCDCETPNAKISGAGTHPAGNGQMLGSQKQESMVVRPAETPATSLGL